MRLGENATRTATGSTRAGRADLRLIPSPRRAISEARHRDSGPWAPAGPEGGRPAPAVLVALTGLDVVVATVQADLARAGLVCDSVVCSVATLGGNPVIALALATTAALALIACVVVPPRPQDREFWESLRWSGVMASVVSGVGLAMVVMGAMALLGALFVTVVVALVLRR